MQGTIADWATAYAGSTHAYGGAPTSRVVVPLRSVSRRMCGDSDSRVPSVPSTRMRVSGNGSC